MVRFVKRRYFNQTRLLFIVCGNWLVAFSCYLVVTALLSHMLHLSMFSFSLLARFVLLVAL